MKTSRIHSLSIAMILASAASTAEAAELHVLCQVQGTSVSGRAISSETVTQLVPHFKIDIEGYSTPDPGFSTLSGVNNPGPANRRSPFLQVNDSGSYNDIVIAPGIKLEALSSQPRVPTITVQLGFSKSTTDYLARLSDDEAYQLSTELRQIWNPSTVYGNVLINYNSLANTPFVRRIAFPEVNLRTGKAVATNVTLICSR